MANDTVNPILKIADSSITNPIDRTEMLSRLLSTALDNSPIPDAAPSSLPTVAKTAANPILARMEEATAKATEVIDRSVVQQEAISKRTQSLTDVVGEIVINKGQATQVIETQKAMAELQSQQSKRKAFEAGGGVEFLTHLQSNLMENIKKAEIADAELQSQIDKPSGGPIDFFVDGFKYAGLKAKSDAAKMRVAATQSDIAALTASQESISRAVNTVNEAVTTETIAAGAQVVAATAKLQATQAELEGLATNSAQITRNMQASTVQVDFIRQEYAQHNTEVNQAARERDQIQQEKEYALRMSEHKATAERNAIELEASKIRLQQLTDPVAVEAWKVQNQKIVDEAKDIAVFNSDLADNVRRGQAASKLAVEDPAIITIGSKKPTAFARYQKLALIGQRADHSFGATPADSAETLQEIGSVNTAPAKVLEQLKQSFADQTTEIPKNKAELKLAFNTFAKTKDAVWRKEIKAGDATNPYHAPPITALLNYSIVQDSALYKTMPALKDMQEFNDKKLYELAVVGIQTKAVKFEEAVSSLKAIFEAAVIYNNDTKMFDRIGLKKQETYITQILDKEIFSFSKFSSAEKLGPVVGSAYGLLKGFETKRELTDHTKQVDISYALTKLLADKTSFFGDTFK